MARYPPTVWAIHRTRFEGLPFLCERGMSMEYAAWQGFQGEAWKRAIDVRAFILSNVRPYDGDERFLKGPTRRTEALMSKVRALLDQEREAGGVLSIDTTVASSPTHYAPGYIDRSLELIVGLQTDAPLKRGVHPFGGIRMVRAAVEAYGYTLEEKLEHEFMYRTTHNDGVFRVYTDEMKAARKSGVITGLPDAYGRGRIIGDYRRVALYGVDCLIEEKKRDKDVVGHRDMDADNIRLLEELYQQIAFLYKLKEMALLYGIDISAPACSAREAIQWTYFAYLAAIKEQNGAAMSLGRVSTFFDIYIERDIASGALDESGAQELIDDFSIKLRVARILRTPEYNELFGGDPMWITEAVGGMAEDGRTLVSRTSYRMIHTLKNLGAAPEPNLTVLWGSAMPVSFQRYCAKVSIETDAIQYENDDLMRPVYGDDYAIACCVSAMKLGKQMQFFGARCNLPKLLLLALNGGRDAYLGVSIGPNMPVMEGDALEYGEVMIRLYRYMDWLAQLYVSTMNIVHYMHDKYFYEKVQLALHDTDVHRFMAFGVAGLSVACDSLSAIRHARVRPVRDAKGLIVDFETEGDFPRFGNDLDEADQIAVDLLSAFYEKLKKTKTYRDAEHTLSVLTITSNVVYGKKTGATPDGREAGEPYAPGANPMHNREESGAVASLRSVAKLPYEACRDGISNTFSVVPEALGRDEDSRVKNLARLLCGYFADGGHHLNINVLNRETLIEAYEDPSSHPNLTIRVSGYAVDFHKLNREQQAEVIARTFHEII